MDSSNYKKTERLTLEILENLASISEILTVLIQSPEIQGRMIGFLITIKYSYL